MAASNHVRSPDTVGASSGWLFASEKHVMLAVCCLAGIAAFAALPWLRSLLGFDAELGGHSHDGYVELARNLAAGRGFVFEPDGAPVFHRPPLYPLLIAPLMLLPEPWHRPGISLIDALLVVATAWLTFRIANAWLDRRVAVLATVFLVGNPWLFAKVGIGMIPILQMFLFTALLAAIAAAASRAGDGVDASPSHARSVGWTLGIGALAAALALTHGGMLLTLVVLFAGILLLSVLRGRRPPIRTLLGSLCVFCACIAPWTLRNLAETGRLIPVAGNAGFAYFVSKVHWGEVQPGAGRLSEGTILGQAAADATLEAIGVEGPRDDHYHFYGLKDPSLDARLNQRMIEDILADPSAFAARVALNTLEYFLPIVWPLVMRGDHSAPEVLGEWKIKLARSLLSLALLSLALAGLLRSQGARQVAGLCLAWSVAAFTAPYVLFFSSRSDYSIGLLPALSVLAALGVFPRPPALTARSPAGSERSGTAALRGQADR